MTKRLLTVLLTICLVVSLWIPAMAFAGEADNQAPTTGTDGSCVHVHDETCGYAPAAEEIPCDMGCTDTDENGTVIHDPECAYRAATEGSPCAHEHNEACGYEKTLTGPETAETAALSEFSLFAPESLTILDLSYGDIIVSDTAVSGFDGNGMPVTTAAPGGYLVTQSTPSTANRIVVNGGSVSLTLQDMAVAPAAASPLTIENGASLTLAVSGSNTLAGAAGSAGILVEEGASLTITGTGTLSATGGNAGTAYGAGAGIGGSGQAFDGDQSHGVSFGDITVASSFTGTLQAGGGDCSSYGAGAGIGGGGMYSGSGANAWSVTKGSITIHGGTVTAAGGGDCAAGIGSGGAEDAYYYVGSEVTILITGGTVIATGGESAAGIGSGAATEGTAITITGGDITATGGGYGAGIGGGGDSDCGPVLISGGIINASAGTSSDTTGAAGIGGGENAAPESITITGGTITATASGGAAGIGGGSNTSYSLYLYGDTNGAISYSIPIEISGANTVVTAYGGMGTNGAVTHGGAGIGSGYPVANNERSVAFDISITGGATVYAHSGYRAQAIGYGYREDYGGGKYYTGYGITLKLDDTISLWALNDSHLRAALAEATQYHASPIEYQSADRHLVRYTDADTSAASPTSDTAAGHLDAANDASKVDVKWAFASPDLTLRQDTNEHTFTTDSNAITGNWATLMPVSAAPGADQVTVEYQWTGTGHPSDVTPPASETISKGSAYTAAAQDSSSEGYTFDGWYTDAACTNQYMDGTPLDADTVLYGRWTKDDPADPTDPSGPTDPGDPAPPSAPGNPADPGTGPSDTTGATDTAGSSTGSTAPDTDDSSNLWLWMAAGLGAFGAVLTGLFAVRQKTKEE